MPQAIRWLQATDADRPFFLWVHLFDPHMPYEPPAPHHRAARDGAPPLSRLTWPEILESADAHGGDLPAEVLVRGLELYGGEVEYADHWVGTLVEELRRLERWHETITVLTADHGECFSNGIFFDHSNCLYDGAIRIPLIIRYPPAVTAGTRIATQVENLDVAPTLLRLSGLRTPPTFQGHDLFLADANLREPRPAFLQHPLYRHFDVVERQKVMDRLRSVAGTPTQRILGDQEMAGARTPRWKYLVTGREERLFDLEDDPAEQVDVAAREPDALAQLRRQTRAWRHEHPLVLQDLEEVDDEILESLRALGYL
ncbi:MAG: sulfatase-like hydrolase/transferase [Thermoanaerobaculia bacterium]|nr:sulfatase-like hydrolase/transferase [Thermoanaerobaculia bacterium]